MYYFLKNNNFFLISLGAVPAAVFRWQINEILIVNIIGCFLLGFIDASSRSSRYKLMFGFGFCGSLTTFSGWSFQLFEFISKGLYRLFFLNLILNVIIGFLAIYLGHLLAKKINA